MMDGNVLLILLASAFFLGYFKGRTDANPKLDDEEDFG